MPLNSVSNAQRKAWSLIFLAACLLVLLLLEIVYPRFLAWLPQQMKLPPAVQLILPRSLPPHQPYRLYGTLLSPLDRQPMPEQKLQIKLSSRGEVLFLPVQTRANGSWSVTLPGLSPGAWNFQLADKSTLLVETSLRVETPLRVHLATDRSVVQPGERVWVSAHLERGEQPVTALPLDLRLLYQGQLLHKQRVVSNAWGVVIQELPIPQQAMEGEYLLELRLGNGRTLAVHPLQVKLLASDLMPKPSPLHVEPVFSQVLKGQAQQVVLSVTDSLGRELPSAWLHYQGQEIPVRGRFAVLPLTAAQIQPEIQLIAGDTQGHLLRLRIALDLRTQGVTLQPVVNSQGQLTSQWRIYAAQNDLWTYAWGIGSEVKQQGQIVLKAGENQVDLPVSEQVSSWLLFYVGSKPEPHWVQLQPRPRLGIFKLQPDHPDALSPLRLQVQSHLKLHFPVYAQVFMSPLQFLQKPQHFPLPRQAVFQPQAPIRALPGLYLFATLFCFILVVCTQLPLFWLLRQLESQRQPRVVPIPSADVLQRLKYGLLALQLLIALLLGGIVLLWAKGFQLLPVSLFALNLLLAFVLLAAVGILSLYLLPVWRLRLVWVPAWIGVWALAQLSLLWFFNRYQPVFLGAFWLSMTLALWGLVMLIRHLFLPLRMCPEDTRQAFALSALTVLSLLHSILILQGVPFFRELEPPVFSGEVRWVEHLPLQPHTQPLLFTQGQWPSADQVLTLPPAFAAGDYLLQIRLQDTQGQRLESHLPVFLQPAVLGQIYAPSHALVGDSLQLLLEFNNETRDHQQVKYRLLGQTWQNLQLLAGEKKQFRQRFDCHRSGIQTLTLEQEWRGRVIQRKFPLYVLPAQKAVSRSDLHVQIQAPVTQDLVIGEEIPVQVRLAHYSAYPRALGLQLGIPSGYDALLETLHDRPVAAWLASVQQVPGYIQIQTRPLAPGQILSFHYRLRLHFPGKAHMPATQLFFLDAPEQLLIDPQTPVFSAQKIQNNPP